MFKATQTYLPEQWQYKHFPNGIVKQSNFSTYKEAILFIVGLIEDCENEYSLDINGTNLDVNIGICNYSIKPIAD
jgi:pterin-4a-carbinolamine dehydratase